MKRIVLTFLLKVTMLQLFLKQKRIKHIDYSIALNNLGNIYSLLGDFKKAENSYLESIKIKKVLSGENNIDYAIAVFEDITDVKEAEKSLQKAKKMAEELAVSKQNFLANIHHSRRSR